MQHTLGGGADDVLTRWSSGLTRWVLGLGLLSLHATVYTLAMVGMVLWNIYDSPNNLWVDEVFYRWTAVLAFHAIAVACGWTAWRLMRSEQEAVLAAQRDWRPVETRPVVYHALEAAPTAEGWQPPAPEAAQRQAGSAHRAEDAAKRALQSSAAWSSALARRTVDAVSSTANRLTHRHDAVSSAPPANPAQTWPEAPGRHRPEDDEFISRFVPPAAAEAPAGQADVVLDVSTKSSVEAGGPAHPVKEPGQTWVEAATSAWHGPAQPASSTKLNGQRDGATSSDSPAE